jgi:hypothetical protein
MKRRSSATVRWSRTVWPIRLDTMVSRRTSLSKLPA